MNTRKRRPRSPSSTPVVLALAILAVCLSGSASGQCILPNSSGTVVLPDTNCPQATVGDDFLISNGLPDGTQILVPAILTDFVCELPGVPQEFCNSPGGALGGETQFFDATLQMHMEGTGLLEGFSRVISVPIKIDFQGAPGSVLEGMAGTTQGIVRMAGTGDPIANEAQTWGYVKSMYR